MKSRLALALLPLSLALSAEVVSAPKNVIYMIGDGMGPAYLSAYRYYQSGKPNTQVAPTVFDTMLVGSAISAPDDDTWVTDSAAAATALASGVKSYNGAIGVDVNKQKVESLFVEAKLQGKSVGVVSTSQVNHATPASFVAHRPSRKDYPQIATQMVNAIEQGELDIVFGGGLRYFEAEMVQMQQAGASVATDWNQFERIDSVPAVALLADVALPYAIDSDRPARLSQLADKALQLASRNPNGFSLMIEGSQIDWCGHANDIACAIAEMDDFAKAVVVAKQFVDNNPDTLLVVTADHSTGGLTLGADGKYQWLPTEIAKVHASAELLTQSLMLETKSIEAFRKIWDKHVEFPLSDAQLEAMVTLSSEQLHKQITDIVSKRSFTGWTTTGHTAVDVPVMAYGKGSERFFGIIANTDIATIIRSL